MKTISEIRRDNVQTLLTMHLMSKTALASRLEVTVQQVYQVLGSNPQRNIGDKFARKIEEAFSMPSGWLDQDHAGSERKEGGRTTVSARPVLVWDDEDDLTSEYVLIPRLDVKASAGNGRIAWQIDEKGQRQAFRKSWMERLGIAPENAATIVAEGSSMAPRIEDGDSLVLDYKSTSPISGRVFVLTFSDELFVKRLFRMPDGGLRIVSDNPDKTRYPDWDVQQDRAETLQIIGRVVAVSGAI